MAAIRRVVVPWLVLLGASSSPASGQTLEPERPSTFVVGSTAAPSPAERADGSRSGFARSPLPTGVLRVAWRRAIGPSLEHAPLVSAGGDIYVLTMRGDLVVLDGEGGEQRRMGIGAGPVGPGALLSDGTLVTVDAAGEAVGVFGSSLRFRTRVGDRGVLVKVAPLALDDGGVVVANGVKDPPSERLSSEMAALDAEGGVRARARVPEQIVWPLVATDEGVAAVSSEGTVYLWSPGREPRRIGSFGGELDGGAAALDGHTLMGVVETTRLVALDLTTGIASAIAVAPTGAGAGALLGPPSRGRGASYVLEMTPTSTRVAVVDPGAGTTFFPVATFSPVREASGSLAPVVAPVHTATLVDAAGTVAFASPDGHVGVVSAQGMTELGEAVCSRGVPPPATTAHGSPHPASRPSAGCAGLASVGRGALLVACESGSLLEIRSDDRR